MGTFLSLITFPHWPYNARRGFERELRVRRVGCGQRERGVRVARGRSGHGQTQGVEARLSRIRPERHPGRRCELENRGRQLLTARGKNLQSDTRIRRPSGCIRLEHQIEGAVCTAPDSPDVNALSASNRRNVEIFSTFEVLLDRAGYHREGSASETLAAVTDVARAILIPRNRDRHRAASIGHDI